MRDVYVEMALMYLFRKGVKEVREFNTGAIVEKHTLKIDDMLVRNDRSVDEHTLKTFVVKF